MSITLQASIHGVPHTNIDTQCKR